MLEVAGLTKEFPGRKGAPPIRALDGIGFTVAPGETYGLLGPNGAGKTTTLRLIAGMLRPSGGQVRFDGHPVAAAPEWMRQATGVVCESGGVYDRLTGDEYLRFFARMFRIDRARADARIDELVERFELGECRRRRLGGFSKGMKQKVHLARALLHSPRLLLLDEPTSGLDPAMTETLWTVLEDLYRQRSVATVLCTHNLDEADRLCDRVAIVVGGRLVREGRPDRLKSEAGPDRAHAARLVLARPSEAVLAALGRIEGVTAVETAADGALRICSVRPAEEVNPLVARAVVEHGGELVALQPEAASLRDVYLREIKGGRA